MAFRLQQLKATVPHKEQQVFEKIRFQSNVKKMIRKGNAGQDVVGNPRKKIRLLREAVRAGSRALLINSPKISKEIRDDAEYKFRIVAKLCYDAILADMMPEDRDFIVSILGWKKDAGFNDHGNPVGQMVAMFRHPIEDVAAGNKNRLRVQYCGDFRSSPRPLKETIVNFVQGPAKADYTAARLRHGIMVIQTWMPELWALTKQFDKR